MQESRPLGMRVPVLGSVVALLAPVFVGVISSYYLDFDPTNSSDSRFEVAEAVVGALVVVGLEIWIALVLTLRLLEHRFTLIPGEVDGDRVPLDDVIRIVRGVLRIPQTSEFVGKIIRDGTISEIEEWARDIENGEARISSQRLKAFYGKLFDNLGPDHEVLATCFTTMDQFWANQNAGPEYLAFNLQLVDKGIKMTRVFGIYDDEYVSNGLKTELIRTIGAYRGRNNATCAVRMLREFRPIGPSAPSPKEDLFLIVEQNKPVLALKWDMQDGQLKNIYVVFNDSKLESLHRSFVASNKEAKDAEWSKIGFGERHINPDSAKAHWERFIRTANTNQKSYLSSSADKASEDDVVDYWQRLAGSLIRPERDGLGKLHEWMQRLAGESAKQMKALSLGCTPETRACVEMVFNGRVEVTCADLDPRMYRAMTKLVSESESLDALNLPDANSNFQEIRAKVEQHHFLAVDWHDLQRTEPAYDVVVGVDVINMVSDIKQLLTAVRGCLHRNGSLFMQTVVRPEGTLRKQLLELNPDGSLPRAYKAVEKAKRRDNIEVGDAFSRLLLSTVTSSGSSAYPVLRVGQLLQKVREIEETLRDEPNREVSDFYKHFEYCNSEITLRSPGELEGNLGPFTDAGFRVVERYCNGKSDYSGAFYWYWLKPI